MREKSLVLGFDGNNVIWDRNGAKLSLSRKHFGDDRAVVPHRLSASERAEIRRLIRLLDCDQLPPIPGALEHIRLIAAEGHKIYVVTSNEGLDLEVIRNFVIFHKLPVEVIGVGYGKSKAAAAAAKRISFFVDDSIEKLRQLIGGVEHLRHFRGRGEGTIKPVPDWQAIESELRQVSA